MAADGRAATEGIDCEVRGNDAAPGDEATGRCAITLVSESRFFSTDGARGSGAAREKVCFFDSPDFRSTAGAAGITAGAGAALAPRASPEDARASTAGSFDARISTAGAGGGAAERTSVTGICEAD